MKKIFCCVLVLPLFVAAQKTNEPKFVISGNVKGLAELSKVFLTDANNPSDTIAKTSVKSGAFMLTAHVAEPNLYELNFGSAKKKTTVFIGNDKIGVTGNVENLKELKITGSPSEDDFVEFQNKFNPLFTKLNGLGQLANSPEGGTKRDSISKTYASVAASVQTETDQFLQTRKSSYVSPFVLIIVGQLSEDVSLSENRYNTLTPEIQNGYYGKFLKERIEDGKVGAIGTNAIDFTQNDTTGKPVTLSSFKGKYVLIDFWASWCGPCRMENPHVVSAYNRFKDKNFTIVGVSLDKTRDPWIKAIKEDNLTWTHVSDLKFWYNDIAVKYKIQSIPQNLLIDPNGKIVAKNLRGADLDMKLCELLGCN